MTGSGWGASRLSDAMLDIQRAQWGQPDSSILVLCDPILGDPAASWREDGLEVPTPHRLACSLGRDMQPYLLTLPTGHAGELLLQATIERALREAEYAAVNVPAPRSVCAWIELGTDALGRLFSELTRKARRPSAGDKETIGLFRFWDPRVFVHLPRLFGPSFSRWFELSAAWRWIDGCGVLREVRFVPPENPESAPIPMSEAVCQSLKNVQYINQVLVHTGLILRGREADHGAVVERYVRHAKRLGCSTSRDIVMYAANAVQVGDRFEQAPCLKALMKPFVARQMGFAQVAMGVPDELWAQARGELASARHVEDGVVSP